MKFNKKNCCLIFFTVLLFPLTAGELHAGFNVNNFSGSFLPGITFSYKEALTENWIISAGITNEQFAQNFLYGSILYNTPKYKSFGGFFSLGALYATDYKTFNPGYRITTGMYFSETFALGFSSGFIVSPNNIFSTQQYLSEIALSFAPDNLTSELIIRYDRLGTVQNPLQRAITLKINSIAKTPDKNFSLIANCTVITVLSGSAAFKDLSLGARLGGSYRTKTVGIYGLYFDAQKSLYIVNDPFKFAVSLEYGIEL